MKTTLSKVQEHIKKQLDSYKKNPVCSDWDRGFMSALTMIKNAIESDRRYAKKPKPEGEVCQLK